MVENCHRKVIIESLKAFSLVSETSNSDLFNCLFIVAPAEKMDMAVLIGSASDKADKLYREQIAFIIEYLKNYKIGADGVLPGVISNTQDPSVLLNIGSLSTSSEVIDFLQNSKNIKEEPDLEKAILLIRDHLFKFENGARRDVQKSILIFLDKNVQISNELQIMMSNLRKSGVRTVIIGQGDDVDKDKLVPLLPTDDIDAFFFPEDLLSLKRFLKPIVDRLLPGNTIY